MSTDAKHTAGTMGKSRRISFTVQEINMLMNALRIAAEDGSLFSDDEAEFAREETVYQKLRSKLTSARAEGAKP
jgi:hypothetical protein